ncbi:MAG: hypothetical protein J0G29_03825 [Alphaproteobacteria bacterium]|nr:hypothetical protein [Alphaproteobacteria bacterium]OJV45241.1 MAG: hypothetical protein BGO28_00355 [Alphaproteobacteria bacterium 43-37]
MTEPTTNKILLMLGRLEGKVDSLLSSQADTSETIKTHDKRLSKQEKTQAYLAGALALCSIIASLVIKHIQPNHFDEHQEIRIRREEQP